MNMCAGILSMSINDFVIVPKAQRRAERSRSYAKNTGLGRSQKESKANFCKAWCRDEILVEYGA